ncbi:WD40/YVTN/BNR-like repeat-containing protein [Campylobacterota bacterium DY0563]
MKLLGLLVIVIVIAITIVFNWNSIIKFKIGMKMDEYTEITTPWEQIDFTTAVKEETPLPSWTNDNTSNPALGKYQIRGIFGIKDIVLLYGSNYDEMQNDALKYSNKDPYYENKNEQAYIFRTEDDGKTFEKISLGHGSAGLGKELKPISVNDVLYIGVKENDTQNIRYYVSKDLGKSWSENGWMPTSTWKDGTLFIEKEDSQTRVPIVQMSKDNGANWEPLEKELMDFYNKTHSLLQLDDNTLVGLSKTNYILLFNIDTKEISNYHLDLPEGKVISRIGKNIIDGKNEFYIILLDGEKRAKNEYSQSSLFFPMTNEHIQMTKKLPQNIHFNISENYIGGFFNYGDKIFGIPVHIYTLDRGRNWHYEIVEKYRLISEKAYINHQFWFVASDASNLAHTFLMKKVMD